MDRAIIEMIRFQICIFRNGINTDSKSTRNGVERSELSEKTERSSS